MTRIIAERRTQRQPQSAHRRAAACYAAALMSNANAQKVFVAYEVPDADAGWELEEQDMPESALHDAIIDLLKHVLKAWVTRANLDALVASNLALRWDEQRFKVGVDPDVAVYVPTPPEGEETTSVCTWERDHLPPRIAVEVVSKSTASKDYITAPNQYAASGTTELWVFDPKRFGPRQNGGPFVLQLWRRDDAGVFRQLYRGDGPCKSPELGAWLVVTDQRTRLRIADDPEGTQLWLTAEERVEREKQSVEREKQSVEREKQSVERARDAAEAKSAGLEAELAVLRAELARLRGG
jgi:Uma2 family endonuclease